MEVLAGAMKCTDPEYGRRLVPYAAGRLDSEEELQFEAHLLLCDCCFEKLKELDLLVEVLEEYLDTHA